MVKVTYVAVPHNCAAKTRISIDAQGFFILEFLYMFSVRKIVSVLCTVTRLMSFEQRLLTSLICIRTFSVVADYKLVHLNTKAVCFRSLVLHVLYSLTMGKLLVHVSDVSRVTPLLKNLHGTEAAKYSEPMRTRTTSYQPASSACVFARAHIIFIRNSVSGDDSPMWLRCLFTLCWVQEPAFQAVVHRVWFVSALNVELCPWTEMFVWEP